MDTEEKYELIKASASYQDMPAQRRWLRLKIYAAAFVAILILSFFAVFAALIAVGVAAIVSLILFFKRLTKHRSVQPPPY